MEQLNVYVQLSSDATHAKMTVQELTVQDLGTGASDCADVVLARWQQPGTSAAAPRSGGRHYAHSCLLGIA